MSQSKLDSLTSLRAFAALLVVLQHTVGFEALSKIPMVGRFPWDHGVSFFFVLSGFILTYVYQGLKPNKWYDFFVARIARVLPAHLFALCVGFVLGQYILESKTTLLLNVLMVHSWIPVSSVYFSYNGVSWSIATEMGFYLLFPFLILGFRQSWWWKLIGVMVVLASVLTFCVMGNIPGSSPDNANSITYHGLVYISPFARLFEFFTGMLTGLFFLQREVSNPNKFLWTVLEIVTPFVAAMNSLCGIALMMTPWPAVNEYLMHSGSVFTLALVILVYSFQKGFVSSFLSKPVFVFLGEISFSVYLLHVILYWFIYRTFPEWGAGTRHLVFWPSLLVLSSFSFFFIEHPLRKLLRWAFSSKRTKRIDVLNQEARVECS